jgi:hypothetical protein
MANDDEDPAIQALLGTLHTADLGRDDVREREESPIGKEDISGLGAGQHTVAPAFRDYFESQDNDTSTKRDTGVERVGSMEDRTEMKSVTPGLEEHVMKGGSVDGKRVQSPRRLEENRSGLSKGNGETKDTPSTRNALEYHGISPPDNEDIEKKESLFRRDLVNGDEGTCSPKLGRVDLTNEEEYEIVHGLCRAIAADQSVEDHSLLTNHESEPRIGLQDSFDVDVDGADELHYERMMSQEGTPERRSHVQLSYNDGEFMSSLNTLNGATLSNEQAKMKDSRICGEFVYEDTLPHDARFQLDSQLHGSDKGLDGLTNSNMADQKADQSSGVKSLFKPLSINVDIPPLNLATLRDSQASPIPAIAVNDDVVLPEGSYAAQRESVLHDSGFSEESNAKVSTGSMDNIIEDESGNADHEQHPVGKVHLLKAYLTNTYPDHKALLAMPGLTLPLPDDGRRSPGALSIISVATVDEGTQTDQPFAERDKGVGTHDSQHHTLDASELEHLQIERARIVESLGRVPHTSSTEETEAHLNYLMGETHALLEVLDDPWYTDVMLPLFPGESKETDEKIKLITQEYIEECRREVLPVIAEYEERRLLAEEEKHRLLAEEDQKRALHRSSSGETFLDRHKDMPDITRSPGQQRRRLYSEYDTPRSPSVMRRTYSETDAPRSPGAQRRALYSESEIRRILGNDRNTTQSEAISRSPSLLRKSYCEPDKGGSSPTSRCYESDISQSPSRSMPFADSHIALSRSISLDIPIKQYSPTVNQQHCLDQTSTQRHYGSDHSTSRGSPHSVHSTALRPDHASSSISGRPNSLRLDQPLSPRSVKPPQYSTLVTKHSSNIQQDLKQGHGATRPLSPQPHGVARPLSPSPQVYDVNPPLSPRGQTIPSKHKENLLSVRRELVNETILSRSSPSSPRQA